MRDFVRPGSFDVGLSMFTLFGYFEDEQEDVPCCATCLTA